MEEKALVSVIVPIYKVEAYLERCIESILGQTYGNLEVILVDDGSPDCCPQICDEWAQIDGRIQVVHKANEGLGMARNTGMDNAHGEYICFVDSDDYIMPDAIELALKTVREAQADIVLYGFQSVRKDGVSCAEYIPHTPKSVYRDAEIMAYVLPNLLGPDLQSGKNSGMGLSACMAMFSMELVKRANWRFVSEREIISEDIYSLLDLYASVSSVAILPKALYCYCENGTSLSRSYRADRYQKVKEFYEKSKTLCMRRGYSQAVKDQLRVPFLNGASAAMKQLTRAKLPLRQKYRLLREIVSDPLLQNIVHSLNQNIESWQRKVLFTAMRKKWYTFIYCLFAMKAHEL